MTLLAKTAPPADRHGDLLMIEAPVFGRPGLQRGERVFLWWSETQRGEGLAGYGHLFSARRDGRGCILEVEMLETASRRFGRDDLAPYRNTRDGSALALLAERFYRHAHNKIAAIGPVEEAFLDGFFMRQATPPSA